MNLLGKVFACLQGRTTGFLIGFFTIGNVLQWLHRLDAAYISFMLAFMSCVVGHSIKEDFFSKKDPTPPATTDPEGSNT
jgi:hypothetical protein